MWAAQEKQRQMKTALDRQYKRELNITRINKLRHCLHSEKCQSKAWRKKEGDTDHLRYCTVVKQQLTRTSTTGSNGLDI